MAKRSLLAGSTSRIEYVYIEDMNGSPITGLVFNSSGLASKYVLTQAASVAITLATQTVTGAYSSGGFVEIDATAMPGVYRFDIPNAALASGDKSIITLYGYTGMKVTRIEYDLWAVNPQDSVRLGMTSLPNAAAGANGGVPLGDASGRVTLAPSQILIKKNVAFPNFVFPMYNSSGALTTGLTVTATRKIDSGSFSACANAVPEIGNGLYAIDLANTDLNGVSITFRFSAPGATDTDVLMVTQS